MSTRLYFTHAIFSLFMTVATTTATVFPAYALSDSSSLSTSASSFDATKLSAMEWRLFAHPYENDSNNRRLSRLEKLIFGVEHSNLDEQARLSQISTTLKANARPSKNLATVTLPRRSVQSVQSTYPRVCELENKVFAKTFESRNVADRLQNLEIRVFGKSADSGDLACRVDALNEYLNSTVSTPNKHVPFGWLCNFVDPSMLPQRTHATTVVDRIETMETTLFGKTHANKTLEKRVGVLEKNILGTVDENNSTDLSIRVAQLWTHLQANKISKA